MSRIAGIISGAGTGPLRPRLLQMLVASRANAAWSLWTEISSLAALGWCGSQQPNVATRPGVLAVMDGTIYNRRELGGSGPDAALLASLYEEHGFAGALLRLNGDFAAAVYDARSETLWLARDRFGVKPLYYVRDRERFAFASRLRALLTLPGVSRTVNHRFVALFAASHYRTFDNAPEESPYAAVAQLPAGRLLRLEAGDPAVETYWSLEEAPEFGEDEAGLAERYRDLLRDAVKLRLDPAPSPSFTLSGGMDSGSVLGTAVRTTGQKQHAFSTIYEDRTYDEAGQIQSMVESSVLEWHPVRIGRPDVLALVAEMIELHDQPVATATWLSHYLLCRAAAAAGFATLFGGLGGDELNAGEYEHFLFFFADLRAAGREDDLQREAAQWSAYHDHPVFRKSPQVMEEALRRLVDSSQPGRCLPDRTRLLRYAAALDPEYFDLKTFEPRMEHRFSSYLKTRTFQDLFYETLPCCLRADDLQSTAYGLERRLPFLDHRLVEFMFRVPGTLKIRNGVTKHLLREAMRGILPEATRTRITKTGWNAPAHIWFTGPGRAALLDLAGSRAFRERGIYNVTEVRRLIEEHDRIVSAGEPVETHMMFLWQLVNLELWFRSLERL